jgi:hypothetical protein
MTNTLQKEGLRMAELAYAEADQDRCQADELVRAMRTSALAELRQLAGPYSGARAREIAAEIAAYDAWMGDVR